MAQAEAATKSTVFVTVMSALPCAHEFPLPDDRTLTIQGRKESKFVGINGMPLDGNQYGETHGVKKEDWDYLMDPKRYGEMAMIKNEVMFAVATEDEKKSRKKTNTKKRSGLEQADPEAGPTKPRDKEE